MDHAQVFSPMWISRAEFLTEEIGMSLPSERRKSLTKLLGSLDVSEKAKFGAWCVCYFKGDKSIVRFMEGELGALAKDRVLGLPLKLWFNQLDYQSLQVELGYLDSLEWHENEVDDSNTDASQGLMNYLAALGFAIRGVITKSDSEFYACSENVINRIDYLIGFCDVDREADLIEAEYARQMEFIQRVSSGDIGIDWGR